MWRGCDIWSFNTDANALNTAPLNPSKYNFEVFTLKNDNYTDISS